MQPQQVGPYTIVGRLGHGGMGAVYEAVEQGSGAVVALKILAAHLADDAGVRSRFRTEIETLKALRHPGIVQLLAYGEDDGQPYFAMELVRGQALDKLLRSGRTFSWQETVAVAAAVAKALKVAHDSGVIHRDLKPANLLVPDGGTLANVKLADFGIAKFFGASGHTAAGNVVGTAEYMAPEQAAGRAVDARSDIYSLGLVMYAMLAGKPPFRAGHYTEVMRMQQTATPPPLTTLLPYLPEPIDTIIQKLLAKNPADRPASALAMGRMLAAVEHQIATARTAKPVVIEPPRDGNLTARGVLPTDATLEVTTEHPGAPADAHLHAPTQGVTAPPPADPTKRDAATKRPTEQVAVDTQPGLVRRSRHVSIEREQVIADARARQARRRDARMQIASAAGILLLLVAGGYLLTRPLTADELCGRIERLVAAASEPLDGMKDAETLIEQFLERFPDDPRADGQRAMKRHILVDRLEKRADLRDRRDKPPYLRIERDYRAAMEKDEPAARLAALRGILGTRRETLGAAVGPEVRDDEELIPDVDLWIDLVKKTAEDVERLVDVENRVKRQDSSRKEP